MKHQRDGWSLKTLEEELEFYNGKAAKSQSSGNFPVYGSNGIIGYTDNFLYANSIILGRVGAYCGAVFYEKKKFWPSDNTIVVTSKKPGNNTFFYYVLKNYPIRSFAGGSAQPLITHSLLKKFQMVLPNEDIERKKIGVLLCSYDNLIDNNSRRIKLLESMAELIYDEWFVKFKFPGHKKVKMIDSETEFGKIPETWEIKRIGDILSFIKRGPSLKYVNAESGIPVLNQRCVRNGKVTLESLQYAEEINNSELYLKKFDILVNSMGVGTLGRTGMNFNITQKMIIHNCITTLRANEEKMYQSILYFNLMSLESKLINLGVGSTGQTSLKPSDIEDIKIIVPNIEIQKLADFQFEIIFNQIGQLQNINLNLIKTRDILLPKLMSGELDVSELDIKISEEII